MALPKFFERRVESRKMLTGLMPGRLLAQGNGGIIECKPVDISHRGLGIVSAVLLKKGTKLTLQTHNQEIHFAVLWSKPDFGKRDLFRYGLEAEQEDLDLEALFSETGCLR